MAAAITPHTAGIYYLAHSHSLPPLADVASVARDHGIPLLVDAAAQLPPADNLRRFIDQGADLVAFSGGKAIGGPQASGILCGRADLVSSALLQMLDLDVFPDLWQAPAEFASARATAAACRITASAVRARLARRRSSVCLSRSNVSSQAMTQRDARNGAAFSKQSLRQRTTPCMAASSMPRYRSSRSPLRTRMLSRRISQRTIRQSNADLVVGKKACCCFRPCRSPASRPQSSAGDYAGTKRGTAQRVELPRQHSRVRSSHARFAEDSLR